MNARPHFSALLTFTPNKSTEDRTPASSGYRAALRFSSDQKLCLASMNFTEAELVFPGDSVTAEITLLDSNAGSILYEGLDFDFYEAGKLVGSGVVSKI